MCNSLASNAIAMANKEVEKEIARKKKKRGQYRRCETKSQSLISIAFCSINEELQSLYIYLVIAPCICKRELGIMIKKVFISQLQCKAIPISDNNNLLFTSTLQANVRRWGGTQVFMVLQQLPDSSQGGLAIKRVRLPFTP